MQENNNFQKIISQWRRLSGEQVESTALISMSGDSHHNHNSLKKEEDSERDLLVPDGSKIPMALAGASATAAIVEPAVITAQPDERQELMNPDKDKEEQKQNDNKQEGINNEAAGDSRSNDRKSDSDYLEHNDSIGQSPDSKRKNEKGDNVDSVYLRPPPPHKARSNTSTPPAEEEDCGIKCLYYTLQCCDCVLM